MDRDGYFNFVASTAKKKKLSLMQSRLPKTSFGCRSHSVGSEATGARGGSGKASHTSHIALSHREEAAAPASSLGTACPASSARTAAVDGRSFMSHRPAPRGPRGPDPWIDHVNNRSIKSEEAEKYKVSINSFPNPRPQPELERHRFNQNKLDEYQNQQINYKINQNQQKDDSERYKNSQNNARVNCHMQNSSEFAVKGPGHNGNQGQAALECYSPKYHHIRPQPKGREASPIPKFCNVPSVSAKRSELSYRSSEASPSVVSGQAVFRKAPHKESSPLVVQNHQAPQAGVYSESQFSYRVNGHPGNAAQASAAAAFFAR